MYIHIKSSIGKEIRTTHKNQGNPGPAHYDTAYCTVKILSFRKTKNLENLDSKNIITLKPIIIILILLNTNPTILIKKDSVPPIVSVKTKSLFKS